MENVILKTLVCLDLKLQATDYLLLDAPPPSYNATRYLDDRDSLEAFILSAIYLRFLSSPKIKG